MELTILSHIDISEVEAKDVERTLYRQNLLLRQALSSDVIRLRERICSGPWRSLTCKVPGAPARRVRTSASSRSVSNAPDDATDLRSRQLRRHLDLGRWRGGERYLITGHRLAECGLIAPGFRPADASLTLYLHRGKAQFAQRLVRGRGGNAFVAIAVATDPVAK